MCKNVTQKIPIYPTDKHEFLSKLLVSKFSNISQQSLS